MLLPVRILNIIIFCLVLLLAAFFIVQRVEWSNLFRTWHMGSPSAAKGNNYQATIYDIYDFTDYFQQDFNNGWFFFDANHTADPKNGITTDTTSPANPAHGWSATRGAPLKAYGIYFLNNNNNGIYYPGARDCRFVIDLTGLKDALDTTRKFVVTDIYGLNAEEAGHTMYFYNFDKVLRLPLAERWKYIAREDSLLKPFGKITTNGKFGDNWVNVPVDDSMRYLLVRIQSSPSQHVAQFRELCIYGHYTDSSGEKRDRRYPGQLPNHKNANFTFGKVIGTNSFKGIGVKSLSYDGPVRFFTQNNYFDTAAVAGVPAAYRFWASPQFTELNTPYLRQLKAAGKQVWFTNQGGNRYNADNKYASFNLDSIGREPEQPGQYKRAGDFAYNFAAKFGSHAVPAAQTKWKDDAGYPNGLGIFSGSEFDNEVHGHGGSLLASFFKTSVEYDGHEGTVGVPGRTGVKAADPNFKMILGGLIEPDTNIIKTFYFFSQVLRKDRKVPFDVVSFHKYFSTKDSGNGNYFDYETQVGQSSEAPEWVFGSKNNYLIYFDNFARNVYKYLDTSVQLWHTENGRSNYGHAAKSAAEVHGRIWDVYNTPGFGPYDSLQAKAILSTRTELLTMFTSVARYNSYAMENQYGDKQYPDLFFSHGRACCSAITYPFDLTVFYPHWYYRACFYGALEHYYADSVIATGGRTGKWEVKFRSLDSPDSVCHVVWLGTKDGRTAKVTLNMANTSGQVKMIAPSFTDISGHIQMLQAAGSVLAVNADARPVMYFAKETPMANERRSPK